MKDKRQTFLYSLSTASVSLRSPLNRTVILKKLAVHVLAAVDDGQDRVEDARGRVDLVERRLEVIMRGGGSGLLERVLIIDPARVDRVHEHTTARKLLGARARHHVEGRLGHVRVRVVGRLIPVELAFHGGHVDDEGGPDRRRLEQPPQPRVEDKGGERVDREHLWGE